MSEEKRVQGARDIALDALMQVERANAWSDEGLRRGITRGGLDSRDAALAARIAYGVMQNRMLLDFYIGLLVQPEGGAARAGHPQYPARGRVPDPVSG